MEEEREADEDDGQDDQDEGLLFHRSFDQIGGQKEGQPDEHDFEDLVQKDELGDDQELENDAESEEINGQDWGLEKAMSDKAELFHE